MAGAAPSNPRWLGRSRLEAVPICVGQARPSSFVARWTTSVQVGLPQLKPGEGEGHRGAHGTLSTTPCCSHIPSKKATVAVRKDNVAGVGGTPTILVTAPSPPPPPAHGRLGY